MVKAFSLALVVGGFMLVLFGLSKTQSISADLSRFFTSMESDRAIWLLAVGIVIAIIGLAGLFRSTKATT